MNECVSAERFAYASEFCIHRSRRQHRDRAPCQSRIQFPVGVCSRQTFNWIKFWRACDGERDADKPFQRNVCSIISIRCAMWIPVHTNLMADAYIASSDTVAVDASFSALLNIIIIMHHSFTSSILFSVIPNGFGCCTEFSCSSHYCVRCVAECKRWKLLLIPFYHLLCICSPADDVEYCRRSLRMEKLRQNNWWKINNVST